MRFFFASYFPIVGSEPKKSETRLGLSFQRRREEEGYRYPTTLPSRPPAQSPTAAQSIATVFAPLTSQQVVHSRYCWPSPSQYWRGYNEPPKIHPPRRSRLFRPCSRPHCQPRDKERWVLHCLCHHCRPGRASRGHGDGGSASNGRIIGHHGKKVQPTPSAI